MLSIAAEKSKNTSTLGPEVTNIRWNDKDSSANTVWLVQLALDDDSDGDDVVADVHRFQYGSDGYTSFVIGPFKSLSSTRSWLDRSVQVVSGESVTFGRTRISLSNGDWLVNVKEQTGRENNSVASSTLSAAAIGSESSMLPSASDISLLEELMHSVAISTADENKMKTKRLNIIYVRKGFYEENTFCLKGIHSTIVVP